MAPRSIPPPTGFADVTIQPIEQAKFNYHCAAGVFTHVVIISAGIAPKTWPPSHGRCFGTRSAVRGAR